MRAAAFGVAAVLAALAISLPARSDDPPQDPPLGAGCEDAVARGVWELAIDLCSPELLPASASDATKAHVLVGRARAYKETGDAARAAADAAEAQRLDPNSAAAFEAAEASRARSQRDLKKNLQAIEAMWDRGEDDRALAELDRVIAGNPKSAQAYALRASIFLARKDEARAKPDIAQATALGKDCQLKRRAKSNSYALACAQ